MTSSFTLPPIPNEFKMLTPFLQRSNELRNTDDVMAYWCLYYATQIGIGLKVATPNCRALLLALLSELEALKKALAKNDAVEDEAASAAYIENCALKVFNAADIEDRTGIATRTTAKRFLAASNFFEILSLFEQQAVDLNSEKMRYAKWRAAEIAKALREGREPTPPEIPQSDTGSPDPPTAINAGPSLSLPHSPPLPPEEAFTTSGHSLADPLQQPTTLVAPREPSSTMVGAPPPTPSWQDVEYEGILPTTIPSPRRSAAPTQPVNHASDPVMLNIAAQRRSSGLGEVYRTDLSISPPPEETHTHQDDSAYYSMPPSFPSASMPLAAPPPPSPPAVLPRHGLDTISTPPPKQEITSQIISKAQKHCRFAISALDYEDVAHARKELLLALALLDG